jgi:hypothetical protein
LALLQPTPLEKAFTTALVVVPYLTLRVPLNVQVLYSCAHSAHALADALGTSEVVVVGVVEVVAVAAFAESMTPEELPLPPPQAVTRMEAAARTRWAEKAPRRTREKEVWPFIYIP